MNKLQNLMLGMAVGDAFGAGYEHMTFKEAREALNFDSYRESSRPEWGKIRARYTDDTQMAIANLEVILSGQPITRKSLADSFVNAYKRDRRAGYAAHFQKLLDEIKDGDELLKKIRPQSIRNGAAMRALPFGILADEKSVIEAALINASITHDTPAGRASSVCMALASYYFYKNLGDGSDLFSYCADRSRPIDPISADFFLSIDRMKDFDPVLVFGEADKDSGVPCDGMRTAGAVLYLVTRFPDSFSVLREAILLGGDIDSVAALALGLKAMQSGLDSLPEFLLRDLENGKFGKDYLIGLGLKS